MDLQILRFFITVAETGNITAAAERLHYAQSNLSTRIRQLENELDTTLFYRNKRGTVLTSNGEAFYRSAKQIIRLADEAVITAKDDGRHARGKLTIGSLEAVAQHHLPTLLSQYHRENPDVRIAIQVDMNDVFLEKVLDHSLDGAFIARPVPQDDLIIVPFCKEKMLLVAAASEKFSTIEDALTNLSIITFPEGSIFRHMLESLPEFRKTTGQNSFTELNSLGAILAHLSAGFGCSYLPESIVKPYLEQKILRSFRSAGKRPELEVTFVYNKDHVMDTAFRLFLGKLSAVT